MDYDKNPFGWPTWLVYLNILGMVIGLMLIAGIEF